MNLELNISLHPIAKTDFYQLYERRFRFILRLDNIGPSPISP